MDDLMAAAAYATTYFGVMTATALNATGWYYVNSSYV